MMTATATAAKPKKRGLGRGLADLGLNELLSGVNAPAFKSADALQQLNIEQLQPGKYQPRQVMDEKSLSELADSIRAQGIIQPILARKLTDNRYEIIAGERRWRAAQLAQLTTVPVLVREVADKSAIAIALIENIQREDLNAIEEAQALSQLQQEFALTHQQIATAVGKSRATVTNLMRLLNLADFVRKLLENGDIEMGHARALLTVPVAEQSVLARTIVDKGLTVREAEMLVRKHCQPLSKTAQKAVKELPEVVKMQANLSAILGADVKIKHLIKGNGQVVIQYHSLDELEGILQHVS